MKPTPTLSTEPPLPATVEACHTVIRESWDLMQEMRQRLQVLEEQVKLNSRTSSKPPSSDGPGPWLACVQAQERPQRGPTTRTQGQLPGDAAQR